jgi:hypothetical protein
VADMTALGGPTGSRRRYVRKSGSSGRLGRSARRATSAPPTRDCRRKNGTKRRVPSRVGLGPACGESATPTSAAAAIAGAPTNHEPAVSPLSAHHNRASRTTLGAILLTGKPRGVSRRSPALMFSCASSRRPPKNGRHETNRSRTPGRSCHQCFPFCGQTQTGGPRGDPGRSVICSRSIVLLNRQCVWPPQRLHTRQGGSRCGGE